MLLVCNDIDIHTVVVAILINSFQQSGNITGKKRMLGNHRYPPPPLFRILYLEIMLAQYLDNLTTRFLAYPGTIIYHS